MKKLVNSLLIVFTFLFVFLYINVFANDVVEHGSGSYCLRLDIDYDDIYLEDNITSIKVNGFDWKQGDVYNADAKEDHVLWTIVFTAGASGNNQKPFPFVSTPGGFDEYGSYQAIPNPNDNKNVTGDEYLITIKLRDSWGNKGTPSPDKVCGGFGVRVEATDMPIEPEKYEVTSNVSITIEGDELEYHYVEDKPDEADVTYFKFDINGGTEENRLVPFTFGNAEYTHNNNEPPKNVSKVTTKQDIPYKYQYNGSGKVEFCVNGGGTDEYTSIKINGVEYADTYAPHTKEEYWKALNGWAQMFCIPNVDYSTRYVVEVKGRNTADENKIPGFGWSYLTKDRSTNIDEEGNFAHGRLEFVSASLEINDDDGKRVESFSSARAFNNYRYKGTGQIFQWGDGNKEYPEEDRRMAWGEAQMPYGTTLRVRIVPDEGYQLTGLAVNENGFKATDTPGEYELTLTRTNLSYNEDNNQFDLNPKFEKVDATITSQSNVVPNVVLTINKGENAFETGTPKLEVTDVASMSPEREQEFDNATSEGFTINNYLEISLYNTLYKGGKKDGNNFQSWDTEIHELQNNATIGLELEDALDGDIVEVIHEVRDADNKIVGYDVIEAEYNQNNKTVTFETDGFSTYAISVKKSENYVEPSTPSQKEMVRVDFDTRSEKGMDPVEIEKGTKVSKPKDPTQTDYLFVGWYTDENCENAFDFNTVINQNITLYAKWTDKVQTYIVKDGNGNSLTFNEIKNRRYSLTLIDITKLTDKELKNMGASREEYNYVKGLLEASTGQYGDIVAFYQIEIEDKDDGNVIHEGPFKIKIKLTDEMRKYNVFKLVYVNDEFKAEEVYELKVENGYLVGEIPHLSGYTLNAVYDNNLPDVPKTFDNINTWVIMLIVSTLAMSFGLNKSLKLKKVRVK